MWVVELEDKLEDDKPAPCVSCEVWSRVWALLDPMQHLWAVMGKS
jgi:hypothetical protein